MHSIRCTGQTDELLKADEKNREWLRETRCFILTVNKPQFIERAHKLRSVLLDDCGFITSSIQFWYGDRPSTGEELNECIFNSHRQVAQTCADEFTQTDNSSFQYVLIFEDDALICQPDEFVSITGHVLNILEETTPIWEVLMLGYASFLPSMRVPSCRHLTRLPFAMGGHAYLLNAATLSATLQRVQCWKRFNAVEGWLSVPASLRLGVHPSLVVQDNMPRETPPPFSTLDAPTYFVCWNSFINSCCVLLIFFFLGLLGHLTVTVPS